MSQTTLQAFADVLKISVDRLLQQLSQAGYKKSGADDTISTEEKKALLQHLRQSHGPAQPSVSSPGKKVVIKRPQDGVRRRIAVANRKRPTSVVVHRKEPARNMSEEKKKEAAALRTQLEETRRKHKAEQDRLTRMKQEQAAASKAIQDKDQPVHERVEKPEVTEVPEVADVSAIPEVKAAQPVRVTEKTVQDDAVAQVPPVAKASQPQAEKKAEPALKKQPVRKDAPRKAAVSKPVKKPLGKQRDATNSNRTPKAPARGAPNRGRMQRRMPAPRVGKKPRGRSVASKHFAQSGNHVVHDVALGENISVSELAQKMAVKASDVIKVLMGMGQMATINQVLDQDTAALVVEELGHKYHLVDDNALESSLDLDLSGHELIPRPPVVTIMGHVDHGKTSLLDHIRHSKVAKGEAGGITQHIGAYHVAMNDGGITFLDTPGHAAFSAMRARGSQATDIVIIVVAADDGVMPQTIEAIQHAKAAEVPIMVAINKMDKPEANPDKVIQELSQYGIVPESWGGDNSITQVSAQTGQGIDELLENILVQAEVLELTASAEVSARGVVLEAHLDRGLGNVATVLVQQGSVRKGDIMLAGSCYGRVRGLRDENGKTLKEAGPSMPILVLGLNGMPGAGDAFGVVENERKARELAGSREDKARDAKLAKHTQSAMDVFQRLSSGEQKSLSLVIKADVQGSAGALSDALTKLSTDEVEIKIIGSGVGAINESDVHLANASQAMLLPFNVRADNSARNLLKQFDIELKYYSVIYDLIDDVKALSSGMHAPVIQENIVGVAEVRDVFRSSGLGAIAGCLVVDGAVKRGLPIRVLRDDVVIYEGELESLRRFKDAVQEVRSGVECGIGVKNYNDIKSRDKIEVYEKVEIAPDL